jgi:poly(beta-D-mannuronate) C5 epimerase
MYRFLRVVAILASGFSCTRANTAIPKPVCDSSKEISVRYSSTSQRIYLESVDGSRGGCANPTTVYQALGAASPLYPLETPGEWMLDESLYILDGITLNIYGTGIGGDCDYLKLRSDSDMIVNVRAHGGSLDLLKTKVTSWDPSKGDVDTDWGDGRSYISAISEVVLDASETCEGAAKNNMGEARMDVENCEIAYLGYEESESWGLSWKLRGICNSKINRDQYKGIGVYGNLLDSDIHHLYYGHYGYAQSFALLSGNSVHDNEVYGFDPHDDSVNLTISNNEVYFNFQHGIIWSKYCNNAIVTGNFVHDNGGVGIFPHFVSNNALIAHNTVEKNHDSGIAFLESSGGVVFNNTVRENVHGIRFSVGSRDNVVAGNTFEDNEGYDVYQYEGNDAVVDVESGNPTNNVFFANAFRGNMGGARLDDSTFTQFSSNIVEDWTSFEMRDSDNTLILDNTFPVDMSYTSTDSCINTASDVSFGDICSNAAFTNPYDNNDYANMVDGRVVETDITATVIAATAVAATQGPSDTQTDVPISTSSPTGLSSFTASPSSTHRSFLHTPSPSTIPRDAILSPNDDGTVTGDGSEDGDAGGDCYEGFASRDLESVSPTPSLVAPGIPVSETDDTAQDSNGSAPLLAYKFSMWIGFVLWFAL